MNSLAVRSDTPTVCPPPGASAGVAALVARALDSARLGPAQFRFAYGEIPTRVRIDADGDGYRLTLRATVGYMPYSAEDRDARSLLLPGIREIARASRGGVRIDSHQNIIVTGEIGLSGELTAVAVMTALVELLIGLRPLFGALGDLLPDLDGALPAGLAP